MDLNSPHKRETALAGAQGAGVDLYDLKLSTLTREIELCKAVLSARWLSDDQSARARELIALLDAGMNDLDFQLSTDPSAGGRQAAEALVDRLFSASEELMQLLFGRPSR